MALIDLKSNLSYRGERVDNLDNTHQSGFTSNRKQGDETEFKLSVPRGVDSIFNERIGGSNTGGTEDFKINQRSNTGRDSTLDDLPRPNVNTTFNKIAPAPGNDLLSTVTSGIVGRVVRQFTSAFDALSFLATPKGVLFVAKQGIAQSRNKYQFTGAYDPLSVPKALKGNIGEVPRHIGGGGSTTSIAGIGEQYGKEFAREVESTLYPRNQKQVAGNDNPLTVNPTRRISYKISDEPISYGLRTPIYLDKKSKISSDFIKFFVKDPQTARVIQFPAYLNDITDNSSAEYTPTRYIGRADQVFVYSGYTRNISFGFKVAALNRGDVPMMWRKIEALKSLTLPAYQDDVIENDDDLRMVAPFVELSLGNYFVNQPGFFSSVNVTIPQTSTWEIEKGYELSHIADVSVEYTFIGKKVPRLTGKQYDIEYEQDAARQAEVNRIRAERLIAQDKLKEEGIKLNPKLSPTGAQRTQGFSFNANLNPEGGPIDVGMGSLTSTGGRGVGDIL
jgi:hypothetical protein